MKSYLRLKNRPYGSLRGATVCSIFILLAEVFCFFMESVIIKKIYSVKIYTIIFPCLIGGIWISIYLCSLLFAKTIWVNNNEIKVTRFNKELWVIKKENIEFCLYYRFKWWHLFIPVDALASGDLMFELKNGKISKYDCCLSSKQIEKIGDMFDYQIEVIEK